MNTTILTSGEPPYATSDTENNHDVNMPYGLGFFFIVLFLFVTLCYGTYIYKSGTRSRPPPPPPRAAIAFGHHADEDNHIIRISDHGLDDDVLKTFPTFVYSEAMMSHKGDTNNSSCSICLGEYKPADVIRLLPECGHLFHVSCVDTWLKVHPTCPVCRNSPLVEA